MKIQSFLLVMPCTFFNAPVLANHGGGDQHPPLSPLRSGPRAASKPSRQRQIPSSSQLSAYLKIAICMAIMPSQLSAQDDGDSPEAASVQTLSYRKGFNELGLQALGRPQGAADVASVTGVEIRVENADDLFRDGTFILEISAGAGDGIVTTASVEGNMIVTDDDLSSGVDHTSQVTLREIQTLAAVFGSNNRVNLASTGSFGTSDQIWLPDGEGSFDKYAYLSANPFSQEPERWADTEGNAIDPAKVPLIYTDGIIINAVSANEFQLLGFTKTGRTSFALTTTFNYLSSVYPVGLTLGGSKFENTFLTVNFGVGDQLWIPNEVGGFDEYAQIPRNPFDPGRLAGWIDENGERVDADTIPIVSSGMIIVRGDGVARSVICEAPVFPSD
jgi:hypothetical protein